MIGVCEGGGNILYVDKSELSYNVHSLCLRVG